MEKWKERLKNVGTGAAFLIGIGAVGGLTLAVLHFASVHALFGRALLILTIAGVFLFLSYVFGYALREAWKEDRNERES